jgi:hypothetical protein
LDKQPRLVLFYIITTIFTLPSYVFFLRLQTYVLIIEVVINWVGIAFNCMQIALAFWVWRVF